MKLYHKCSALNHLHHNMTENEYEIFASTKEGSDSLFSAQGRDLIMVFEISEDQIINQSSGDTGDGKMSPKYYGYDEIIATVSSSDIVELIFNCEGDIEDYLYELAGDEEGLADLFSRLYEDFFGMNIELSKTSNCGLSKEFLNFN